jgi:hypothetical protein
MNAIAFVIRGEQASRENSREIVTPKFRNAQGAMKARPMSIKSDKARDYERAALLQIPAAARVEFTGSVRVTVRIFYASERPDLDESVVLDVMQSRYRIVRRKGKDMRELVRKGVYVNDRQVKQKFVLHGIDRANPRAEIVVEPLTAQQIALVFDEVPYDVFDRQLTLKPTSIRVHGHIRMARSFLAQAQHSRQHPPWHASLLAWAANRRRMAAALEWIAQHAAQGNEVPQCKPRAILRELHGVIDHDQQ